MELKGMQPIYYRTANLNRYECLMNNNLHETSYEPHNNFKEIVTVIDTDTQRKKIPHSDTVYQKPFKKYKLVQVCVKTLVGHM